MNHCPSEDITDGFAARVREVVDAAFRLGCLIGAHSPADHSIEGLSEMPEDIADFYEAETERLRRQNDEDRAEIARLTTEMNRIRAERNTLQADLERARAQLQQVTAIKDNLQQRLSALEPRAAQGQPDG